jgi:hypothetical protein
MAITVGPNISIGQGIVVDDYPIGQVEFTTPGTYTWIAPMGVKSVSAVCVGGGGGGGNSYSAGANSGGGGGLGWKNNITVVPGQAYTVQVGVGGTGAPPSNDGQPGGNSWFISASTVAGLGGLGGVGGGGYRVSTGGSYVGDGGGNGGTSGGGISGAGGAGGYSGNGGNTGSNGSGGGGAGGGPGGGVGIYGQGTSGTANGGGGSGGTNGSGVTGGVYGGGGLCEGDTVRSAGSGGKGAVRLIWGPDRAFPSTNTGNL